MSKNLKATERIWNWKDEFPNIQMAASSRRRRALIQCIIMLFIASVLVFFFHHLIIGVIVYSMASLILVTGFFFPSFFNLIEILGRSLARWVGIGLTWLLLAPFFYIVFSPARLILKLRGKDPMKRTLNKDEDSYWHDRMEVSDSDYYRRQY